APAKRSIIDRKQATVVRVVRTGDQATRADRGTGGIARGHSRVDVVALRSDEGVLLPLDVAVAIQHVLTIFVVVVAVTLFHVLGRRGSTDSENVVIVARRAGIHVSGDSILGGDGIVQLPAGTDRTRA